MLRHSVHLVTAVFVTCLAGRALSAQSQSATLTVRGVVTDAASSLPLAGAQLTLAAAEAGAVFGPQGSSPTLLLSRTTAADSVGAYVFHAVPTARYRLLVRRIGYEPALIDIDVRESSGTARLSIGLVVVPIRLKSIRIESDRLNTFGRIADDEASALDVVAEAARDRQSRFLGTDVRELTAVGSREAASTGEVDIFRALHRLPGVTGFDDGLAELWVRGARWDQARVSFDGLPVFNPFHNGGTMSGIGAEAVGAVFLHPGVRPVSLLGQGASLIDIRSRAAVPDSTFHGSVDANLFRASVAVERARRDGRAGVVLLGRRSFLSGTQDWFLASPRSDYYSELFLRSDRDFGDGRHGELSVLRSSDIWTDFADRYGDRTSPVKFANGSMLARITYRSPIGGLATAHTIGVSQYDHGGLVARPAFGVYYPITPETMDLTRQSSEVRYATLRGEITPRNRSAEQPWSAGYELWAYSSTSVAPGNKVSWRDLSPRERLLRQTLTLGSLWAERRWAPTARVAIDAGARGDVNMQSQAIRFAPSIQARYMTSVTTRLSAGVSRTYQDAQELAPIGTSGIGRGIWFLSGNGVRPLRADQASVGIERWLDDAFIVDANVYVRRLDDLLVSPLPNGDTLSRTLFTEARLVAHGVELSARRIAGPVTGSLGYTYGKSTERVDDMTWTGSGDRTHALDATTMVKLRAWRIGTGFTYMTGAPYTRIFIGLGRQEAGDSVTWQSLPSAEGRNAERLPTYASLDLFVERAGRLGPLDLTTYFAVRNLTDRENLTYASPRSDRSIYGDASRDVLMGGSTNMRASVGLRVVF